MKRKELKEVIFKAIRDGKDISRLMALLRSQDDDYNIIVVFLTSLPR